MVLILLFYKISLNLKCAQSKILFFEDAHQKEHFIWLIS